MLDIQRFLPHRYPFLLVDRVVELERGKRIKAYKNITFNEPMFNGHFPGEPIFPGVLIIEAMAQCAGLLGSHYFATGDESEQVAVGEDSLYLFVGADKARFKRPVVPGDCLMMEARVMGGKRKIWKFECSAQVGDERVCGAEILCALGKKTK